MYEGIELCKKEKVDFILAVGGGSVIDSAKAIGIGTLYDGDFWDFYSDKAVVERTLPIGTVLTIAAAGSEGSDGSVITLEMCIRDRNWIMEECEVVPALNQIERHPLWNPAELLPGVRRGEFSLRPGPP